MAAPTTPVFINSDLGEGLGLHAFGHDEALMSVIDVANVACGFHAGDPATMRRTVALAQQHGVRVGSHPGLPDLAGFGRRRMNLTPDEVDDLITYQTGALVAFLDRVDMPLNHVKPHGALWGMLAADEELMTAAARAVKAFDVPFFGLAGTAHERVCEREGIPFHAELYVDMDYDDDAMLVLVRAARATDPAAAARRVRTALAGDPVPSVNERPLDLRFDTVCVHSDASTSLHVARAVREAIDAA